MDALAEDHGAAPISGTPWWQRDAVDLAQFPEDKAR